MQLLFTRKDEIQIDAQVLSGELTGIFPIKVHRREVSTTTGPDFNFIILSMSNLPAISAPISNFMVFKHL